MLRMSEGQTDMHQFIDFSQCPDSERNGSYAGNAGSKRGILYEGQCWIVKYPKTTRSMRGDKLPSYTSSPLSEYLGSHVFQILGIDAHDTLLGFDHGKIVVACRDFRPDNGILKEFRALKNAMTPELNDRFDIEIAESATGDRVNIEDPSAEQPGAFDTRYPRALYRHDRCRCHHRQQRPQQW